MPDGSSQPARRPRYRLRPTQRLKGRTVFDLVYETGSKRTSFPLLVKTLRRADQGPSRLGISIGRRCGNAVVRNLIKRRLREAYRLAQQHIPEGRDYMVIVRPHKALPMLVYQDKLRQLLR